jgi:predicted Fe-S protein YdhL (DUF1289 family)
MIKSPCIDKCGLVDGVCKGCKRTGKEITKWKRMSDEEKQNVLDRIKKNK